MKSALFALAVLAATPPTTVPKPVISATVPVTVNVPPSVTSPEQARPFFDAFSWQSLIALNWPAASPSTQRNVPLNPGDPNAFLNAGRKTPVWMTWKQSWELFGQRPPTPWTSFSDPAPPCSGTAGADTLVRSAKAGSYLDDVNQALSYPLIDQHLGYVFYEVRYNQAQYTFIFDNKYYLQSNFGKAQPVVMPMSKAKPYAVGAMMVKAAWKVMTKADDQSRYFVTNAQVYDPIAKQCSVLPVGLVGFHIAQKADGFAEWIWSTFEQVDNVPDPAVTKPPAGWSFNNGTNNPKTQGGWANRPGYKSPNLVPISQRTATQVMRLNAIPASTIGTNKTFQAAVAKTPWRYYELVFTQWPTSGAQKNFATQGATVSPGVTATYEKNSGNPFPLYDVTNTTMETYLQSRTDAFGAGGNSCMQCHYVAGAADFSWGLFRRAHP